MLLPRAGVVSILGLFVERSERPKATQVFAEEPFRGTSSEDGLACLLAGKADGGPSHLHGYRDVL